METELRQIYLDGKLSLFVGAGVSVSCGLPDWSTLAVRVVEETWPNQSNGVDFERIMTRANVSDQNPLDSMRIARRIHGNAFNSVVSRCLYSKGVNLSETVESIVSLRNIRRICCFNYDDVLEEAYEKGGIKSRPLTDGDEIPLDSDEVLIFHPHGFLPRNDYAQDYSNKQIVLSEDDYHELYASPYSWANVIQLNLLMSFNVLFIGCSLKDPSMRRLLDICKKMNMGNRYFAIMKVPDYESDVKWWGKLRSFSLRKDVEEPLLNDRGVTPIWVDEYSDIPKILSALA